MIAAFSFHDCPRCFGYIVCLKCIERKRESAEADGLLAELLASEEFAGALPLELIDLAYNQRCEQCGKYIDGPDDASTAGRGGGEAVMSCSSAS